MPIFKSKAPSEKEPAGPSETAHTQSSTSSWHEKSLSGQLGNLTTKEQAAFEQFRKILIDEKLYTPATSNSKPSHSDITLTRFLRARRFDPSKAYKQFSDSEAWRKKYNVDELYATFPFDEFERARRLYPTWTGRRDKRGLPVFVYRIADVDSEAQKYLATQTMDRRYQQVITLLENLTQCVLNICIAVSRETRESGINSPDIPYLRAPEQISSSANIIDLGGVSLGTLWNIRSHLQQPSALATANYPETLDRIFVVNSPSFFPTVWGWIKGWFDEGTQNKVQVLGNPAKDPATFEVLNRFIDKSNIPRMYGGDLEWDTTMPPNMDERTNSWVKDVAKRDHLRGPVTIDPDAKRPEFDTSSRGSDKGAPNKDE